LAALAIQITQHVLLIPASINLFHITAFFNETPPEPHAEQPPRLHRGNWGTASHTVRVGRNDVHLPDDEELNKMWEMSLLTFALPSQYDTKLTTTGHQEADQALYSPALVLAWVLSNMTLCGVVWHVALLNEDRQKSQEGAINFGSFTAYLSVVSWGVGGFWAWKFLFVLWYRLSKVLSIHRLIGR
jgi:hypothetical protein